MLSEREFEQIKTAIEVASGYNIDGAHFVPAPNVLYIVSNYVDWKEKVEPKEGPEECPPMEKLI